MKGKKQGFDLGQGYNFLKPIKLGGTGFQSFGNMGMRIGMKQRPMMQGKQMKIKMKPLVDMKGMHAYDLMGKRPEKKKMNYKQSYQFFNLRPFGDIDKDGVPNWRDCRPFDPLRQGKHWDVFKEKVGGVTEKVGKAFGRESKEEEWKPGGEDLTTTRRQDKEYGTFDESTKRWHYPDHHGEYRSPYGEFPQTATGEWPQPETKGETALIPYSETDVVPYSETDTEIIEPELSEEEPSEEEIKWVGSSDISGREHGEPETIDAEFEKPKPKSDVTMEDMMEQLGKEEKGKELATIEYKAGEEKEEEETGGWNVYVRFHKTKWDQYAKTADEKEAMKMINFLRHTKGVVDARASPRDILKQLNRQLVKEQFVGAIEDRGWGENIKESMKLDKDELKKAKKWEKRYARGPVTGKQMEKYLEAWDARPSESKYRASMYRPESRSSSSRTRGLSSNVGLSSKGLGGNVGLGGGTAKGSWWDNVKAQGQPRQQPSRNIYAMGSQARQSNQARTVPPNAMGTGRVQRYNPVTARQSFINRPSVGAPWQQKEDEEQDFQMMEGEYQQQGFQQPQQQNYQSQQNVGFGSRGRARGLGLTGGQRTLTGVNRRM